ncbi:zinc ribbon domain-containing protein [SCandidatus Aminicenantes bacterium Aminicenantia_JdfR_composite]|jgi:RNA polymerase subunit RPABC4/transcription elongation factor Spt4|nr:zinc ribbon domain-containing protein [SCandidatus Aminicenantes bacterium Aminicenantia_JdfR_composite]MCP2620805.1 zinc ribbon domain-containing protein [Candidatus Aminicenantes bacterium AC-334-E05]
MQENKSKCLCPYCNYTISYDMPFCKRCEVEFIICEKCEELVRKEEEICPYCGSELKKQK